jgi:hypothetical protein
MDLDRLLDFLWREYSAITPDAPAIHRLLTARGEEIVNDHIAFRTFNRAPIGLESLARPFLERGYTYVQSYRFEKKGLRACSYAHPEPGRPRIFISELLTERFSPELQETVRGLAAEVPARLAGSVALFERRPTWRPIRCADYERLLAESEYAGWLAAFGLLANHFTVSCNHLRSFANFAAFNDWLAANGFRMNRSGGTVVKGSPADLLEQSAILASRIPWDFAGGERHTIPSCYYEFALRHVDPATGRLFDGFVTPSADRIFESTDAKEHGA